MAVLASSDRRKNFFESTASFWEEQYHNRGLRGRGVHERTSLGVAAMLANRPQPGSMVLDLGAGPGIAAEQIAAHGVPVCAVDFCEELVRRTRHRLLSNGHSTACVIRADAHKLPFADESFGGALCIALVTWVQDPGRVISELYRILEPGSTAVITCRTVYYCGDLTDPVFWIRRLTPESVQRCMRRIRHGTPEGGVKPNRFTTRRFNRLLVAAGFSVEFWRTLQFGDFRFLQKSILPMRYQVAFNDAMEKLWRVPLVRRMGWTYYVQVRKP